MRSTSTERFRVVWLGWLHHGNSKLWVESAATPTTPFHGGDALGGIAEDDCAYLDGYPAHVPGDLTLYGGGLVDGRTWLKLSDRRVSSTSTNEN